MPYIDVEKQKKQRKQWKATSRAKRRKLVADYLSTHPCVDCGETDLVVLDFDHRNPKDKLSSVSSLVYGCKAFSVIVAEMNKCDIRCANCHRKRHVREDKNSAFISISEKIEISDESRNKIRQSKLGKLRDEETKDKISKSLIGNHCRKINDLTGQIFGQLTVLRMGEKKQMFDPKRRNGNGGTRVYWWCQCSCGSPEKQIVGIKLTTGRVKGCGCLRRKFYGNQFKKVDKNIAVV